ncbi:unnamed protein product [Cylicocyclus nassatus]|uniref:NTR domain-containing protein n=1 Tax=Cylicocyclus nassatus TaxID=53992 RepID=A0AA36GVJ8_CYLNA|nr:unnamed protein product [Cylicocyclus nassatus]
MKGPIIFAIYFVTSTCLPDDTEKRTTPSLVGSRKGCECKPLVFPMLKEFCYFDFISKMKVVSQETTELYPKSSGLNELYNPKPIIKGIRYEVKHLKEFRNVNNNTRNVEEGLSEYIFSPKPGNPCALELIVNEVYTLGGFIPKGQRLRANLCGLLQWKDKEKYLAYYGNDQCRDEDQRRNVFRKQRTH